MPSTKEKIAAKRKAMTEEEKSLARKKDAMRKRKRRDMSPETLDKVREADRKRWDIKQRSMTEEEREKVRESHRQRKKAKKRREENKCIIKNQDNKKDSVQNNKKERARIRQVLRRRKERLLLSEEMKLTARKKAREGMTVFRKEGRLREFMQRKRRGFCEMKWKKFLAANPKFMALEEKKVEEIRQVKRQEQIS